MSCFHGNHPDACDICDEVDAASKRGYEAGFKECLRENFTTPPQRKPLTDEEIDAVMPQPTEFGIVQPPWNGLDITILRAMARAIEAAHGIRENT